MEVQDSKIKVKVIVGFIWKFSERISVQIIQLVVQIVLARLLMPEDFGVVAIINIFISVATILIQYGLPTALVQKKDAEQIDFSSVFYVNLFISIVLYIILYFFSPIIADFYDDVNLIQLLRVQAIILFPGAFSAVQAAILSRKMDFKKSFRINFASVLIQGIVGIGLAAYGLGIWSLVFGQIANSITLMIFGFITVRWRPRLEFSAHRVRVMYVFGGRILFSSLLEVVFNNIYSMVIGKIYQKDMLGYYNRGQSIPNMITNTLNDSIQGVLFPALSRVQDNHGRIKEMTRRSIVTSSFLVFPIMIGCVAIADPLIRLLLTDKWIKAVPFLQLSCISMMIYPIHTANLQAINAIGRTDVYLQLEIIKKALQVLVLVLSIPHGIYAMMVGSVISSMLCVVVNTWPNKKLLDYSLLEQMFDIAPSLLLSVVMGICAYSVSYAFSLGSLATMCIQIVVGAGVYIIGALLLRLESFIYLVRLIADLLKRVRK